MIARIRKGNDFKHIWPITWNGQPEDFSDATDITLTAMVYGEVKALTEGVNYHIDGGNVVVDFTPAICDITGTYTVELNYIKPSVEFTDGDRRSAVDVQAFQIVNTSAESNATEGVSLPSEAMAAYALKYDDLTEAQKDELRGKGITSIDLTGEVGDTKTYTITYADGLTFDFSVTDGHTPIFTFVGTVIYIDGVAGPDLKGETGNGIASVELTSTVGLVKTYTITFTDSTTTTFTVTDGSTPEITFQGTTIYVDGVAGPNLKGEAGRGITSVELLSTVGLSKTYRITFTDATTFDYVVTDGAAGTGATVVQTTGESIVDVMSQKAVTDEIAQLAGEVNLLDAVQGAKIKDIENVLSTANLNQSAQLSVSGRKTISLPKNAANGGMSVKLEGLTAENLIVNGDFRNGTAGWSGSSSISVVDGWLKVTSTSNASRAEQFIPNIPIGSKIYVQLKSQPSDYLVFEIWEGGGIQTNIVATAGGNFSAIRTTTANTTIRLNTYQAVIGRIAYIGDVMLINLTTAFGAGNEPTKEQCDAMFSDYFEGVKSFEPTGRVRSVDKNGLNPTVLYLTAPELRSNGTVKDEIRKWDNGYELVKRISEVDGTVLTTPVITPISYGGILNSAESGTVYHEPIIADAGVYGTKMDILLTDYPITSIEEIIKHKDGIDTYLDVSTAVIAADGLSFTHPDLASGDLVLFTYAFDKESTNGNITATFYDSNAVKIDTVTGKAYKITDVITNGVLTRTITEV